ncbi:MAG TPA: hypothetical protein VE961_24240 [Pyrinomonadaceae bacterium]|nr:hypothetical protein [Pyrinomonadaceae bacterium]
MKRFLTQLAVLLLLAGTCSHAQTKSETLLANGANNEDAKATLDLIAERAGRDKLIIMIARQGDGETRTINRRRLGTASQYLQNTRGIPKERVISAESTRVRGLGKLEVYVDGKLLVVFTFRHARDFAPEG